MQICSNNVEKIIFGVDFYANKIYIVYKYILLLTVFLQGKQINSHKCSADGNNIPDMIVK
jgi:hypothetical protein